MSILCRIKLHKWEYSESALHYGVAYLHRECSRCGLKQINKGDPFFDEWADKGTSFMPGDFLFNQKYSGENNSRCMTKVE
jgi:hypothetical protein